jgi:hypothetical protein
VTEAVGGCFDGAAVRGSRAWGWVGARGAGHALFAAPADGRELYRLERGRYVAAQHTHAECPGCGALTAAGPACRLCGAALG